MSRPRKDRPARPPATAERLAELQRETEVARKTLLIVELSFHRDVERLGSHRSRLEFFEQQPAWVVARDRYAEALEQEQRLYCRLHGLSVHGNERVRTALAAA